jgi:CubicO group peptidase (beta-lactamase class C family)
MARIQFRILYRQFLFRMVDLDLLSADAKGDLNKLFGQLAALLVFVGLGLTILGFGVADANLKPGAQLVAAWSGEHFLIATTMLVVGLFAVLSWDSTFPDKRDVLVLAPLPIRTRTIFLAKITAVATALCMTVAVLHITAGFIWPIALNKARPAIAAPAITYDLAMPPVGAADLQSVLNRDLKQALQIGSLAPGNGGGASIGIWKDGVKRVFAYGSARPDSIFEIGSVSKTFTGLILARSVAEGKMKLDEPLRDLLPPGTVARPAGDEIRLLDLITHRSGLPRDANNLHETDRHNPFAGYGTQDLYAFIKDRGVEKPQHAPLEYSNVAVALLGEAMADRIGISYADLLKQQVTALLGMHDTAVHISPEQRNRVIQGYAGQNHPVDWWDLDAYAAAGGIHSTAGDMLTYLLANLHPEMISNADTFRAALTISHELRGHLAPGWNIALAWFYNSDLGIYMHQGATAGCTSYAFFSPTGNYAAVVLLNGGPDSLAFFNVLGEHIRARLAGAAAISLDEAIEPASGGFWGLVRLFTVYWITMLTAGAFIFCCALGVQGLAAQLLPRQLFLRVSSFLQLSAFGVFVSVYFVEPKLVAPGEIAFWQSHAYLDCSPSYWFLGLFQELNGSPALAPLARRAWIGIAVAFGATAVAYSLAYLRTMRKIVEAPDIVPRARSGRWLPSFGNSFETAVGQFTVQTLLRSRQHRLMIAFYLGIGFAATILFPKWQVMRELAQDSAAGRNAGVSLPLLGSTVLLMGLCVVGTRVAFNLPIDLRANWIFRITPMPEGPDCLKARRRAFYALAVAPIWAGSTALSFSIWPWQAAAEHSLVLALLGTILAEVGLRGVQKIPFTCSYLPGKSNFHMSFLLCTGAVLSLIAKTVQLERRTFDDISSYAALVAILSVLGISVWWRNTVLARSPEGGLQFEEAADPVFFELNLHRDGVTPIPNEADTSDPVSLPTVSPGN